MTIMFAFSFAGWAMAAFLWECHALDLFQCTCRKRKERQKFNFLLLMWFSVQKSLLLHECHETCHAITFIVLVNSHQRWKQTRNRVCFNLWCELTLALWCHRIIWSLFFLEIKCNGMMNFMEFMQTSLSNETSLSVDYTNSTGLSFLWYQIKQRKFGDWKSYYF